MLLNMADTDISSVADVEVDTKKRSLEQDRENDGDEEWVGPLLSEASKPKKKKGKTYVK